MQCIEMNGGRVSDFDQVKSETLGWEEKRPAVVLCDSQHFADCELVLCHHVSAEKWWKLVAGDGAKQGLSHSQFKASAALRAFLESQSWEHHLDPWK